MYQSWGVVGLDADTMSTYPVNRVFMCTTVPKVSLQKPLDRKTLRPGGQRGLRSAPWHNPDLKLGVQLLS